MSTERKPTKRHKPTKKDRQPQLPEHARQSPLREVDEVEQQDGVIVAAWSNGVRYPLWP